MTNTNHKNDKKREMWNERAQLGEDAGTKDLIAKQLEIEGILEFVEDGMSILDAGCGNGITALEIAQENSVEIVGFDFAENMIEEAKSLHKNRNLQGSVKFMQGNLKDLPSELGKFDFIYTERAIINLSDWPEQRAAIKDLTQHLKPDGCFAMCENSKNGLDKINEFRQSIDLETIEPPWHNRYLRDEEIDNLNIDDVNLDEIIYHSSTYYFLSRIVNAWQAKRQGEDPSYDAPINKLALDLPRLDNFGQNRIWVWERN